MKNARRMLTSLAIVWLAAACSSSTGPDDGGGGSTPPPPPPPPPPADNIQMVTFQVTEIEVTGSCDYDGLLQDNEDGEFDFRVAITPEGSGEVVILSEEKAVYQEDTTHNLRSRNLQVSFERNVTDGQGFVATAVASEWDGLFVDGDFDGWTETHNYSYTDGSWEPGTRRFRFDPAKGDCGVFIRYDITSTDA